MKSTLATLIFSLCTALAAPLAHATASPGIEWREMQGSNVDALFAEAKAAGKPLFLYWGAVWCPPCNQVKATIFNRQDFIVRSRQFIPVYLDGDAPGAQALGTRFKVRGYPTMILFKPDGTEITRLPGGEVDPAKYMQVLTAGMNAARPARLVVADALAGKALPDADWRMLAYYAWGVDEAQLVAKDALPGTLQELAAACPPKFAQAASRLQMQAIAAQAQDKKAAEQMDKRAALARVLPMLANAAQARENFDFVMYSGDDVVRATTATGSAERGKLTAAWNVALDRLMNDASVGVIDRMSVLSAKVALTHVDTPADVKTKPPAPPSLQAQVRRAVAQADKASTNGYERQALIPAAADVLSDAGLLDESDALLKAELPKAVAPYYHMLGLSANAKLRGDKPAALDWSERAWTASKGPATRIQWGTGYVNRIIELTPEDAARVEKVASAIINELEAKPATFEERNQRSLQRMGKRLAEWSEKNKQPETVKRLAEKLNKVCGQIDKADPAAARCGSVFAASDKASG